MRAAGRADVQTALLAARQQHGEQAGPADAADAVPHFGIHSAEYGSLRTFLTASLTSSTDVPPSAR